MLSLSFYGVFVTQLSKCNPRSNIISRRDRTGPVNINYVFGVMPFHDVVPEEPLKSGWHYSLFTIGKPHSQVILTGDWGFLKVNIL